jgi:hypothetical protein
MGYTKHGDTQITVTHAGSFKLGYEYNHDCEIRCLQMPAIFLRRYVYTP